MQSCSMVWKSCSWQFVTGLEHRGCLQAVNRVGESEWSELGDCMTAASVPSQPEAPYITTSTATSAILGWHAPCDNGAPILHYQVAR